MNTTLEAVHTKHTRWINCTIPKEDKELDSQNQTVLTLKGMTIKK